MITHHTKHHTHSRHRSYIVYFVDETVLLLSFGVKKKLRTMVNPFVLPFAFLLKTHNSPMRSTATKLFSSSSSSILPPLVDPSTGEAVPDLDSKLDNKRVAFFFTAGWCPMCTSFEPSLIAFRQAAADSGKPVELIYVTSDRNEDACRQRASSLEMMTVPFGDEADKLKRQYNIWAGSESFQFGFGRRSGVPACVVLDRNGQELAFIAAESQGSKALGSWPLDDDLGVWGSQWWTIFSLRRLQFGIVKSIYDVGN